MPRRPIISCLGTKPNLRKISEQALKEYQAALKADPTAQSVKARLASIYFSLGDVPNAVRYAEEVADGPSQDARILTHMAGILAGGGKGEKALSFWTVRSSWIQKAARRISPKVCCC